MYSNNILNCQESTTILNACTKKVWKHIECTAYLKELNTIHHQGLRLALGVYSTYPIESLYTEANEPPLTLRREKLALQYSTKLLMTAPSTQLMTAPSTRNTSYILKEKKRQ